MAAASWHETRRRDVRNAILPFRRSNTLTSDGTELDRDFAVVMRKEDETPRNLFPAVTLAGAGQRATAGVAARAAAHTT